MPAWPLKHLEAGKVGFCFPRNARLSNRNDFQRVFEHANKLGDQCFTVLFTECEQEHARLGLAITKKVIRRAVDRNRIKRIARESFRLNQHRLGMVDIVILARRGLLEKTNQQLFALLDIHWSKLEKQRKEQDEARCPAK